MLPAPLLPAEEDLRRIASLLTDGEQDGHPGGGRSALHARDEVLQLAEMLGAPVVKTLSGKAVIPDDSPYTTGGIGLLGTKPTAELMERHRHLVHGRHELPLHQAPAQPRQGQGRPDRGRPQPGRSRVETEVPVVGDAGESPLQACCRC